MSLSVDARHCGTVYIIRCNGRIGAGEECSVLETSINRGLRDFRRLAIDLDGVGQLDSTGIGLLVRYLSHTRSRGGDLRLSTPQPFVANVLRATKLTTVFKVYESEEEAVVSFLKEPGVSGSAETPAGPLVLFRRPFCRRLRLCARAAEQERLCGALQLPNDRCQAAAVVGEGRLPRAGS